ncbi:MAG: hypothetical protein IPH35_11500 [Rhodoferax sp.]|nr:hypothetical protein [Rhodoferax sp.]
MSSSDNETTTTPSAPESKPTTKSVRKPTPKVSAKSVSVAASVTKKPVPVKKKAKPAAAEPVKEKKPKLVRDSFTMPKLEFAVIDSMKLRAAKLAAPVKKTELIRAGIKALAAMPDADFLAAINAVPNLKTGRPAKNQEE